MKTDKQIRNKIIQLCLTEIELNKIDLLANHLGIPRADVIRRSIEYRFDAAFPVYLRKGLGAITQIGAAVEGVAGVKQELSDEQMCEKYAGKVEKDESGNVFCRIGFMKVPITMSEKFENYARSSNLIE